MTPEQILEKLIDAGLTIKQVEAVCDITIKAGNAMELADAFRFIKYDLLDEIKKINDEQLIISTL